MRRKRPDEGGDKGLAQEGSGQEAVSAQKVLFEGHFKGLVGFGNMKMEVRAPQTSETACANTCRLRNAAYVQRIN